MMPSKHLRVFAVLLVIWGSGVAPDTSIHYAETSNEQPRQSTPNIPNNTSQTSSTRTDTYFDEATISVTNITVQSGEDAFLVCSVMNLKGYVISWIRHTDINLLSVGKLRYTQDQRYQIFCDEFDSTWTLKIKQARKEDEGYFECQISTAQPVGHKIYLKVVDPEVTLIGEDSKIFASAGSDFNLTCQITQIFNETKTLTWTHDDQEINHQSTRGGVFIITEHDAGTVSHLIIKNLTEADSGQYSCSTSAKSRKSLTLLVSYDNVPEAATSNKALQLILTFYFSFLYCLVSFIM